MTIGNNIKFAIFGALSVPFLAHLNLQDTGSEYDWYRYFIPFVVGGFSGFLIGLMKDKQIKLNKNLESLVEDRTKSLHKEINERKQAEDELKESEEKYRSMMESMDDAVYICSPDFRIEFVNAAMNRKIGHDAIGKPCSQVLYGLDEKCPWCVHEKIQKGEYVTTEVVNPKDGRTYHVSHSPIFHKDNSISKMTIFRDITQRKQIEDEREKTIKELENALGQVKQLSGLLPICSHCKNIRDDKGYWNQIEAYVRDHSDAEFSHGICPECAEKYYPDYNFDDK